MLWEIHTITHKNESFSDCLRLVRNLTDISLQIRVFLLLFVCLFVLTWQWLLSHETFMKISFQTAICGSESGCALVHMGVPTTKQAKKAVFLAYSHKKKAILPMTFYWSAYWRSLEVVSAPCQSNLLLMFSGKPALKTKTNKQTNKKTGRQFICRKGPLGIGLATLPMAGGWN